MLTFELSYPNINKYERMLVFFEWFSLDVDGQGANPNNLSLRQNTTLFNHKSS